MPLDPEFIADCPYGPEAIFFDEVLDLDRERDAIRVRMPTHEGLPLTEHQRVHPTRHPRHVNGGLMVHITGMVAMAHVFFLHDLRHADGWIGYGALINKARYPNLATIGDPLELEAHATRIRGAGDKRVIVYDFRFTQNDALVFESSQTAMFMRVS
jgi:hypothetical protein